MTRKQKEYRNALYLLIAVACSAISFIYTAFYTGWGHHPKNALPFASIFVPMVLIITLIVTDNLTPKNQLKTLSVMLMFWTAIALAIYLGANSEWQTLYRNIFIVRSSFCSLCSFYEDKWLEPFLVSVHATHTQVIAPNRIPRLGLRKFACFVHVFW